MHEALSHGAMYPKWKEVHLGVDQLVICVAIGAVYAPGVACCQGFSLWSIYGLADANALILGGAMIPYAFLCIGRKCWSVPVWEKSTALEGIIHFHPSFPLRGSQGQKASFRVCTHPCIEVSGNKELFFNRQTFDDQIQSIMKAFFLVHGGE